jgi:hypothetical protein
MQSHIIEYAVESKWTGFWGGWGSEDDIAERINARAREGWRLIRTESKYFNWWLIFWFPRAKLLMIFERSIPSPGQTVSAS